jgi:predicted enzyme related to lactoylglutathione lyase
MIRYVHTNIIARDWRKLSQFYQKALNCKPLPEDRGI